MLQEKEHNNESIKKFKEKEIDILFSTKCSRGIDFPGDQCNSIVFTKYPNPDIKSPFWEILKKTNPGKLLGFV
jgi:Rad3-related DNA helicase